MKSYKWLIVLAAIFLYFGCSRNGNNYLESLSISTGELIPEFSENITEYCVTSLNSLGTIMIVAIPQYTKAKVEFNITTFGKNKFKVDTLMKNKPIEIKVRSEDGSVRIYKIKTIPDDFPTIKVKVNSNPLEGYIFLTNFSLNQLFRSKIGRYLMILNNKGLPVYYRKMHLGGADFKMQNDGTFSYFTTEVARPPEIFGEFYRLDKNFNQIGVYRAKHGYTDMHDFKVLRNGNTMLLGVDIVDKDLTYLGGQKNAKIWDFFLEETDRKENVALDWKSFNHFKITDIINHYDLTKQYIEHGANCNSIFEDSDGNIILSSRKLDEITKIDRKTGKFIWRMGGVNCENNQFKFINDPFNGFSHQHSVTRLENGNLLMFDNGNHNSKRSGGDNIFFIPKSRIVEYKIDEEKKTATLVWEYRKEGVFIPIMGSVQRLDNGNTLICWSTDIPCITEVDSTGKTVLEMDLPKGFQCYNAFKFKL